MAEVEVVGGGDEALQGMELDEAKVQVGEV